MRAERRGNPFSAHQGRVRPYVCGPAPGLRVAAHATRRLSIQVVDFEGSIGSRGHGLTMTFTRALAGRDRQEAGPDVCPEDDMPGKSNGCGREAGGGGGWGTGMCHRQLRPDLHGYFPLPGSPPLSELYVFGTCRSLSITPRLDVRRVVRRREDRRRRSVV